MADLMQETYNIDETFYYDYEANPRTGVDLITSEFKVKFIDIAVLEDTWDDENTVEDSY